MQLPDVLPPAPHPLRAELLVDRHVTLDPDIIGDALAPGDVNFGVKFPFREGEQAEHIWLSHIRREGDKFVGVVSATPRYVKKVSEGITVRVPIDKVSDWTFANDDALHGQYTLRVLLHTLPQPMRRDLEARLVPLERL